MDEVGSTELVRGSDVVAGDVIEGRGNERLRVTAFLTGPGVADIARPGLRVVDLFSVTYDEPLGAPRILKDADDVVRVSSAASSERLVGVSGLSDG